MSLIETSATGTISGWPVGELDGSSNIQAPPVLRLKLSAYFVDGLERVLVLALYGGMAARLLLSISSEGDFVNLLLLPSEGLIVFFLLIRRTTTNVSRHPGEWLLALAATCAPLLAGPGYVKAWIPATLGGFLLLLGLLIQIHAKLALGRSFGLVPAHRGLMRGGPYRFVRHPMYAGYLLGHLAFLLLNPTLWNLGIYTVTYCLQIPRLLAEERFLSRDPHYREYQKGVRYRLMPGLF